MCAGGVLAYLVLIPMIKFFGEDIAGPLAPGTIPIGEMGPAQIRSAYILYIGAGAVAAGGIIASAARCPPSGTASRRACATSPPRAAPPIRTAPSTTCR